jgi:hypothetical protein
MAIIWRLHAIQRMYERQITAEDVRAVIAFGEIIRTYLDDRPYPSRLILGWRHGRPLHVVVAEDVTADSTIVITVYQPDPSEWDDDFRRRKP